MAESDPPQRLRVDERCHGGFHVRKQCSRTCMVQQRLIVTDHELTELDIKWADECRDAKQIRSDLGDLRHSASSRMQPCGSYAPAIRAARRKSRSEYPKNGARLLTY